MNRGYGMACFGLLLALTGMAQADQRPYVWTYNTEIMRPGGMELEYYATATVPDMDERGVNNWKHQLELEYGVSERFDIALYQVFAQRSDLSETGEVTSEGLEYDGFKLRGRARLVTQEQAPLSVTFYAEYEREADLAADDIVEGKLLFTRDFSVCSISYNQIAETALSSGSDLEHKYAAGISGKVNDRFSLAMESTGNYSEGGYTLGPTVVVSGDRAAVRLGALWGLDPDAADVAVRLITALAF